MRRRAAAWCAGVALVAAAGCNSAAINRRELVVVFDQNATQQQHEAALRACASAAPHASPEPIASSSTAAGAVGDVRFRVDHASDRDINQLLQCLRKQPGVNGFNLPDASG